MVNNFTSTQTPFDVEQAVIGACLKDSTCLDDAMLPIRAPEYFEDQRHRSIWKAMLHLAEHEEPIDIVTVSARLDRDGVLPSITRVYITELADGYFSTANVEEYAQQVADAWRVKEFGLRLGELLRPTMPALTIDALTGHAEQILLDLSAHQTSGVTSFCDSIMDQVEKMLDPADKDRWIETRVHELNQKVTGLFRGDMCIVAGPPSMGKTMFALDLCVYNHNLKSLYVSIDQTQWAIGQRLITSITGLSRERLLGGKLSEEQKTMVDLATAEVAGMGNFFVLECTDQNVLDIRSEARRLKRTSGLDIVVIDYIQQVPGHRRFENRNLEITEVSRVLKAMAKELDIVLVVLSQLNRSHDSQNIDPDKDQWGLPRMTMLRESGSLEQDANMVIFPWVPAEVLKKRYGEESGIYLSTMKKKPWLKDEALLIIGKNKDGETGQVKCKRNAVRMRFYSETKRLEDK